MKGGLGKKVGPLPLWAWLVIAAAGIAAGVYIKNKMANSSTTQTAAPASAAIPDTTGSTGSLGSSGTSSGDSTGGVQPWQPHVPLYAGGGSGNNAGLTALEGQISSDEASFASALAQIGTSGASAGSTTNDTTNNYYTTTTGDPGVTTTKTPNTITQIPGQATPAAQVAAQTAAQTTLSQITKGVTLGVQNASGGPATLTLVPTKVTVSKGAPAPASGAGAVKAGTAKTNKQAAVRVVQ